MGLPRLALAPGAARALVGVRPREVAKVIESALELKVFGTWRIRAFWCTREFGVGYKSWGSRKTGEK